VIDMSEASRSQIFGPAATAPRDCLSTDTGLSPSQLGPSFATLNVGRPAIVVVLFFMLRLFAPLAQAGSYAPVVAETQPKIVKIFGSGGLQGLEAYQSGFLISPDGHILTVWSYVLDAEEFIFAVLDDGQRFPAKLVNHDPRLEIALLKIEASGLPHFDLANSVNLNPGSRVLAFSNLFGIAMGDEPASVLHGNVAAVTKLAARRGAFQSIYRGSVFVLDAMTNNPGAAGGALTDRQGQLAGVLGKELRNAQDNTWLNYAIPISEVDTSIKEMLAGRAPPKRLDSDAVPVTNPHTLPELGVVLIPDVLPKTPPFVDEVRPGSPAEAAKLRRDDLILFVDDSMVSSCRDVAEELTFIDRIDPIRFTVQRGQQLIEIEIAR
jgi:S1-C subfamily serine protease